MKPFVKWAGGKRQILTHIKGFIDDFAKDNEGYTYYEPFLGGGAVFFDLAPHKAVINDLNEDLMNAYRVIGSDKYRELIEKLKEFDHNYNLDRDGFYYDTRNWDRDSSWPQNHSDVERAARMIFLNHTCYNGLYRVNSKGQFNTPIGRYKNPTICDAENITAVHDYLSSNDIKVMSKSYEEVITLAKDGDIIYVDPPYDYEDDDGFTKYQMAGFTFEDFKRLKECCDKAIERGAFVIISNNATEKVLNLFEQDAKYTVFYDSIKLSTLRNINCHGTQRRTGNEVIVCGMNIALPQANEIDKVINLLAAGQDIIDGNKEKAKEVIGVSTERQVSYYLSALQFLEYLDGKKKLTDKAKSVCDSKEKIAQNIHEFLKSKTPFKEIYKKFKESGRITNVNCVIPYVKDAYPKLSDSTIIRRSSTVKAWVEWMYKMDSQLNS